MPRWWSRRLLIAAASVVVGCVALACLFGPVVRWLATGAAERRNISVRIGSVRPDWCGVRLVDLAVRPNGVGGVDAKVERACISLGWTFRVEHIALEGVAVELHGAREKLFQDLQAWHNARAPSSKPKVRGPSPLVTVSGMRFAWLDGVSAEPRAEARDIDAWVGDGGGHLDMPQAAVRAGRWSAALERTSIDTSPEGLVRGGHAATLLVRFAIVGAHESPAPSDPAPGRAPSDPAPGHAPSDPAPGHAPSDPAPGHASDPARELPDPAQPSHSILPHLPDLPGLREAIRSAALAISSRLAPGASAGVDALTWLVAASDEHLSLSVGPGPFSVARDASLLDIRFSTDPSSAGTPLAVQLLVPTDTADVALALDGGPISLARLGIREGAAGLVDVAKATTVGRGRIVLAGDGSALTFDGDGGVTGLSIRNARLAADVVRGLSFDVRARGVLTSRGELRVDDFDAGLGEIRLSAGAAFEQDASHLAGSVRFEVPRSDCQSLLDSIPAALLPSLHGTRMDGTFEGHGRFEFDTRSLQDLKLDYDISDLCRIAVPVAALAPERFERPFAYRIHLPDGSTAEQTTGPGSDNWTPLGAISPYMQVAVLTTEDGAFPHHHGFNRAAIRSSIIANLQGGRFLRGASTITMQLAKNLFLSREKTVSRKLEEVVLTEYLEQTFSKDRLMELYLNVIEFGPSVYGITAAAEHYFGRSPAELNLGECLFLSSILPAPLRLGTMREAGTVPDHWMNLLHRLMETAHRLGRITDAELAEGEGQPVVFWNGTDRPAPRPAVRAQRPVDNGSGDVQTDPVPEAPDEGP